MYKQVDDAARVRALEEFMEGKGLSRHSSAAEIAVRPHSAQPTPLTCRCHLARQRMGDQLSMFRDIARV